MNRLFRILTYILAAICLASCGNADQKRMQVLKIYNWADYIDESVLEEFPQWYKEQTGEDVEIIYQIFDINEVMFTKIALGHEDFDVVCPSEYMIQRMVKNDLLLPLDKNYGNTPDYTANCSPFFVNQMKRLPLPKGEMADYAVPYMWGTAGILYNTEFVTKEEVSTWDCLWEEKFKGKVLIKDAILDVYCIASICANKDKLEAGEVTYGDIFGDFSQEAIDKVEEVLKSLKPNIAGWEADFGKEMMTKGNIYMNFGWSGDAVWAIEEAAEVGVELDYQVPEEGSIVWFDGWVIPKYAKNVKAANYFINYMCRPDVVLRNMDAAGYVSAMATEEIMEEMQDEEIEEISDLSYFFGEGADSLHINPVQYPDKSIIGRCDLMRDFTTKNELESAMRMWSSVKGDNLNIGYIIFIFGSLGIMTILAIVKKVKKYRHELRRRHRRIKKRK